MATLAEFESMFLKLGWLTPVPPEKHPGSKAIKKTKLWLICLPEKGLIDSACGVLEEHLVLAH